MLLIFLLLFYERVSKLIEFIEEVIIPIWALKKHDLLFYGQKMSKTGIGAK